MKKLENNNVKICGFVLNNVEFSHEIYGESFFKGYVKVVRQSGIADVIPFVFSEKLGSPESFANAYVCIEGNMRTFNYHSDRKTKLNVFVFATLVTTLDDCENENHVSIRGYICKPPIYRKTPLGRDIADLIVAVNRPYGKSDYIPCICWGRNAIYAGNMAVGTPISINGMFQSRCYVKKYEDSTQEEKTAYEISAINFTEVSKEEMDQE